MRRAHEGLIFGALALALGVPAQAQQGEPAGRPANVKVRTKDQLAAERRQSRPEKPAPPRESWQPWKGTLLYGRPLTTDEERKEFHSTIRSLPTYDEQLAYWKAHVERMQRRALDLGVSIPGPPRRPGRNRRVPGDIYARHLMTEEERDVYIATWRELESPQEIAAFEAAHAAAMLERAERWSIELNPPGYLPENARRHFEKMEEVRKLVEVYTQALRKQRQEAGKPGGNERKARADAKTPAQP